MKAGSEQDSRRRVKVRRYVLVGTASSNNLYPCSEENLLSKVGRITSIERSTTGCRDKGDQPAYI